MKSQIVLIIYGLVLILGGFMGLKKGSRVSLIAGALSGVLVLAGAWGLSVRPHLSWIFLTCINILLSLSFTSRLIKTRSFMPSGMLLMLSLSILLFCLIHLRNA